MLAISGLDSGFANGPDRVAFAACFGRAPSNMPGCSFVMPKSWYGIDAMF
jgi:hypothetical protein